jgi:iron uptake system component EfeO
MTSFIVSRMAGCVRVLRTAAPVLALAVAGLVAALGMAACGSSVHSGEGKSAQAGTGSAAKSAAADPLMAKALVSYRAYIDREAAELLAGTRRFATSLAQGDVQQAKALYGPVRRHYDPIEPAAESFGEFDQLAHAINGRVSDVANPAQWTGFHRIEQILWGHNTTQGTTPYAQKLLADETALDQKLKTMDMQGSDMVNGAVEMLNKMTGSRITGEEDPYSHTDMSDCQGDLSGASAAFEMLRPVLVAHGDSSIANEIAARFAAVQKEMNGYRRNTPLGFAYYDELTSAERQQLAQRVDSLAEPMSNVTPLVEG